MDLRFNVMKYITDNIAIDISKYIQEGSGLESIFKYNPDINKTAYINWSMDCGRSQAAQFVVIGEAYFSAALNLIQQCIEYNGDKKADFWIFPILFNIIHGTEVYLKAINKVVSAELNKQQSITEGGHNLQNICKSVLKNINMLGKNKNCDITDMIQAFNLVRNFVDNIYIKTNDMTFVRYPSDKRGQGHFYVQAEDNVVIDLKLLKEQIAIVVHVLDFLYSSITLEIENRELLEDIYTGNTF